MHFSRQCLIARCQTTAALTLSASLLGVGCTSSNAATADSHADTNHQTASKSDAKSQVKTGVSVSADKLTNVQPTGEKPKWGPTIDPQMQAVIEEFGSFEPPKYPELTPFQVRNAVLPANAVQSLAMKTGLPAAEPKVDIAHKVLPVGPDEGLLVRTYTPIDAQGKLPVVVYYHGGGWVIADLDAYEPSAKALAQKANAVVVSVAYRLAPEHTYPAAHEDAFAAYEWVTKNAGQINGDPKRIAIAGESAGGNMAITTALLAAERGVAKPVHVVSVYPVADGDVQSASYDKYAQAKPLNRPFMEWFFNTYTPDWENGSADYPLINLVDRDDLGELPPTTIINAEIDPLAAEGEMLAQKIEQAGGTVMHKSYPGVTHEFFGMHAVLEQAEEAQQLAADQLNKAFKR